MTLVGENFYSTREGKHNEYVWHFFFEYEIVILHNFHWHYVKTANFPQLSHLSAPYHYSLPRIVLLSSSLKYFLRKKHATKLSILS